MELTFQRIENPQSRLLEQVKDIYECSFPEEERRDFAQLKRLLMNPEMQLWSATEEHWVAGFFITWDLGDFCFLEHLAVDEHTRGKGYGKMIVEKIISLTHKPLILEVELPTDAISQKRIDFYTRLGLALYPNFTYEQPSYDGIKPSVPMLLMAMKTDYTPEQLARYAAQIKKLVYERFYPNTR